MPGFDLVSRYSAQELMGRKMSVLCQHEFSYQSGDALGKLHHFAGNKSTLTHRFGCIGASSSSEMSSLCEVKFDGIVAK